MRFLITGHTGFKGSWLALLLLERGHEVNGIALEPIAGSLFDKANLGKLIKENIICDIRDYNKLEKVFKKINPDVIIHLAAQALVRESYKNPLLTYQTNVMGTINVLKASQAISNLKAQLIATTDKVYKNVNKNSGYIEGDEVGGRDPYSSSKALADLATQSWMYSFENAPTAIARAGNVIGGGDICVDRLIPDLVKSYSVGNAPKLRFPESVRPWQHVLDCLNGYLKLVDALLGGYGSGVWNIGPEKSEMRTVSDVANIAANVWGAANKWESDSNSNLFEESTLLLNSDKAVKYLKWKNKLDFEEGVTWTIDWYKNIYNGSDALEETLLNIRKFQAIVN